MRVFTIKAFKIRKPSFEITNFHQKFDPTVILTTIKFSRANKTRNI